MSSKLEIGDILKTKIGEVYVSIKYQMKDTYMCFVAVQKR